MSGPFRCANRCVKCDNEITGGVTVKYKVAFRLPGRWNKVDGKQEVDVEVPEHLEFYCVRCSYVWRVML